MLINDIQYTLYNDLRFSCLNILNILMASYLASKYYVSVKLFNYKINFFVVINIVKILQIINILSVFLIRVYVKRLNIFITNNSKKCSF